MASTKMIRLMTVWDFHVVPRQSIPFIPGLRRLHFAVLRHQAGGDDVVFQVDLERALLGAG
jgi:hypothetical protein